MQVVELVVVGCLLFVVVVVVTTYVHTYMQVGR